MNRNDFPREKTMPLDDQKTQSNNLCSEGNVLDLL